jgi:hypothetical protein
MLLKSWRFATIALTALLMGMTFCHVLELPAKTQYPASLYLTLHRTLYVAFGPPNVGAFVEPAAVLASLVLLVLVRGRHPAFELTATGAACLVASLAVYFAAVEPANIMLRSMAIEAPHDDWTRWRDRWEYGHAAHFALHLIGFCALLLSVIRESAPATAPAREGLHAPARYT